MIHRAEFWRTLTMAINPIPLTSSARNTRALITVNGTVIKEVEYIEYVENNYYQPDTFHVKLPLYGLQEQNINIEYWQSQPALMVEIFIGTPPNPLNYSTGDLQSLILGGVNDLNTFIFSEGQGYVEFDGFDLSKLLINNKTIDKFPNQTSSQIATFFALKEGLNPIVTATGTPTSYYYTQDYVQMGNAVTEWDLLTYLSQKEGFQVFVRGKNLYFQPRPVTSAQPYQFQAQTLENGQLAEFNGTTLEIERNLNYARDIIVNITSWHAYAGRVTATARATPTKRTVLAAAAQPIGEAQTFDYFIPGLSKEQAQLRAQTILQEISQHERILSTDGPGDIGPNIIRKDSVIQLSGVSTSTDQTYFPDTITRTISAAEGSYRMQVRAKNHSPQSVVII